MNLQIPVDGKEKVGDLSLYTDDPCRYKGQSIPTEIYKFSDNFNWECFALTSQCRDKRSVKAKRVKHLRNDISVMSLEIVAQMLNPYRFLVHIKISVKISLSNRQIVYVS